MKTRQEFEPDLTPPRSIREIVEQELTYTEYNGKTDNPLVNESIDDLLKRVYQHIERQALQTYRSNDIWALRRWALENILKEEIVNEATVAIADGLLQPLID